METFTAQDMQNNARVLRESAMNEPVIIMSDDRPSLVLMSMQEYDRLRGRRRIVGSASELSAGLIDSLDSLPRAGRQRSRYECTSRPMARVPEPRPGLVFRYGYVWIDDYLRGHIDPAKDRPACILARIVDDAATLEAVKGLKPATGDVLVLPITTRLPRTPDLSIEMNPDDKRACGWMYASVLGHRFRIQSGRRPNADLSLVPGTDRFDYGVAPPGLMRRIARGFLEARRLQRQSGLRR